MIRSVALIVPCYNEQEVLPVFYETVRGVMDKMPEITFTLLFVNDGSSDRTLEILKAFAEKDKRVRYLSFSRNFGKEAAMFAGFCNADADAVAVIATLVLLTLAMDRLLGRDSMGGGDIKLLGVAALYVGWRQCLMLLPLACCLGLASALLRPSGERAGAFPFGPSIALALWVTLLVGPEVEPWLRAWVI